MSQPLANRLSEYADSLRFEDLSPEVVHETKRRFIDSLATAAGAMDADAYSVARRCALRVDSRPGATLIGGGTSSIEWATFVNGLLIRYLDYNDTYLSLEPAHPSDNLAAVLAVGEATGSSGKSLIFRRLTTGEFFITGVTTSTEFTFTTLRQLTGNFPERMPNASRRNYDILPDGRIVGVVTIADAQSKPAAPEMQVVLNWQEELKARVPVK